MNKAVSEPVYVLDASALLCLLFGEPGADRVEQIMESALVSAVNYHEVLKELIDRGVEAQEARYLLRELDINVIAVNREQAEIAGTLEAGSQLDLSIGDRSCLALALTRRAIAVTADRTWQGLKLDLVTETVR